MAQFIYRALTKHGQVVKNRVEEGNRLTLIRKLKANDLYPINIVQTTIRRRNGIAKRKKNINAVQASMDRINNFFCNF